MYKYYTILYYKEKHVCFIVASKESGLEVNAYKTKYVFMSRYQNAERSHNIKIYNSSYERVEQVKYLGKPLKHQNSNQEQIESSMKSRNACYHSVQNILSYSFISKNIKIKKCGTIILPVVLYGCETWSLTLREERGPRVLENKVLQRIFGPKRDEATGKWRKLNNEELNDLYWSQILFG